MFNYEEAEKMIQRLNENCSENSEQFYVEMEKYPAECFKNLEGAHKDAYGLWKFMPDPTHPDFRWWMFEDETGRWYPHLYGGLYACIVARDKYHQNL